MKDKKKQEIEVQDKVAKFYEGVRYKNRYTLKYNAYWNKKLVKGYNGPGLVLDNGCGVGILANFIDKKKLIGCDISLNMLLNAKKRMDKLVNSDSEQLPFKDDCFDFMVVNSLLHHLDNEENALAEMKRIMKKGSRVIISEPISNPVNTLLRGSVSKSGHFSEQHHDYGKKEFADIVKKHFKIKKIDFLGYLGYPMLGFPDVVDVFKYFPFKGVFSSALIAFDNVISKVPLLRKLSWHMIIKAER